MRKILASFLAASMVASIGATMTFAANTNASATVNITGGIVAATTEFIVEVSVGGTPVDSKTISVPSGTFSNTPNTDAHALAGLVHGMKFTNLTIDKKSYDLTLKDTSNATGTTANDITGVLSPAAEIYTAVTVDFYPVSGGVTGASAGTLTIAANSGSGDEVADITENGAINVEDVILCDGQGYPIPLTEKNVGADKDQNENGGVQGSKTVYFMIKTDANKYDDDLYWKLRVNKGDNGKYVKKISEVSKIFGDDLYNVTNGDKHPGTGNVRHRYIKVELNDIYTDDEYKITVDMRLTPTSKAVDKSIAASDDIELKVKDFYFWMKNIVKTADNSWRVGINGLMLSPLDNDWNDVTWYDEDGDLAHLKFFADSDVDKFYSKLSTKWEHADYASYFNDQDAYIFDFTGSPKLSATSRADLEIYNPFVNEDGNETIDPSSAVIYQVIDGDLFDVTDSFEYKEADSGDMAYVTRTRFLGTYIICERAVEEAVDSSDEVPADLVPEDTTPSEVTPDNNSGGKAPANTGRFA